MDETPVIPGRECGGCTLCCKVLRIAELQKPQGKWCPHCEVGHSCRIYEDRPGECRTFFCGYLVWPSVEDFWYPPRSKMVIVSESDGAWVSIYVDPDRPDAWRLEPYYSAIKRWSASGGEQNFHVVVCAGRRATVVFPDREVDLGVVADDERIVTSQTRTAAGLRFNAIKVKADDPRLAAKQPANPAQFKAGNRF